MGIVDRIGYVLKVGTLATALSFGVAFVSGDSHAEQAEVLEQRIQKSLTSMNAFYSSHSANYSLSFDVRGRKISTKASLNVTVKGIAYSASLSSNKGPFSFQMKSKGSIQGNRIYPNQYSMETIYRNHGVQLHRKYETQIFSYQKVAGAWRVKNINRSVERILTRRDTYNHLTLNKIKGTPRVVDFLAAILQYNYELTTNKTPENFAIITSEGPMQMQFVDLAGRNSKIKIFNSKTASNDFKGCKLAFTSDGRLKHFSATKITEVDNFDLKLR